MGAVRLRQGVQVLGPGFEQRALGVEHVEEAELAVFKTGGSGRVRTLRTDIVPGAQSAYAAATTGFENGKFGFLDVLDAQRTLLSLIHI